MVSHFHIQWIANYLVYQTSIEPNLHPCILEYMVDTGDFHSTCLVSEETYNHTGFALTIDLLFELSFNTNVLYGRSDDADE